MANAREWAQAQQILAAPAAPTFRQLRAIVAALGGTAPRTRAEAEAFLGTADLSAINQTQKNATLVILGIRPDPNATPAPDPAAGGDSDPAAGGDSDPAGGDPNAGDPNAAGGDPNAGGQNPPARRRIPLLGWLAIILGVLLLGLTILGIAAAMFLRSQLKPAAVIDATATPTAMVLSTKEPTATQPAVVATLAPTLTLAPTEVVATAVAPLVVEADSVFHYTGGTPAYSDFRAAVREPGDTATFVWNFDVPLDNAVISRIWPDDILVSATLLVPGQDPQDLTELFGMFSVPANGTGDAALDAVLKERGVNIVDGEILQQNKFAILLGDIPAGSKLVFEIKDNEELAVSRGIGVVINNIVDAFTVSIP